MARTKSKGEQCEDPRAAVLRALLRPIARYCLRHSVKLQRINETMKAVLVEIGREELAAKEIPANVSRLSAMTGVHRKDVTRLLEDGLQERPAADVYTRILGQWKNHPGYSAKGTPRPLVFSGGQGKFAQLVSSVTRELSPYTVLFEFERLGMVERRDDRVILKADEFVPKRNLEASFRLVEADFGDLLSAVEENTWEKRQTPNLHLTTRYDNVAAEHLPEIRRWLLKEGAKLHCSARNYLSKFDRDINPRQKSKSPRARVALGSFSLAHETEKKPEKRKS